MWMCMDNWWRKYWCVFLECLLPVWKDDVTIDMVYDWCEESLVYVQSNRKIIVNRELMRKDCKLQWVHKERFVILIKVQHSQDYLYLLLTNILLETCFSFIFSEFNVTLTAELLATDLILTRDIIQLVHADSD